MVLPTSCIKNHCLNKHLLNGTNHAKDSKLPEIMAKLSMLPFLPLQKSMHDSLETKQHGFHAISIFSNFLCPCKWSWFTSVWYVFQIAQHAQWPEYNTTFAWTSYIKGDFTLPSPSSCSFRWATCGAFPLSFAASWGCTIIGWVLDCCLC